MTLDGPIKLAHGFNLPISVATQTVAALARKGAGKTYTMMKLVEELLAAGVQVVVLDAIGVWYGLRLSKDGEKSSGLNIPILGGYRGDIPLKVEAGALIATTLVESGQSAILDVSQFRKDGRKHFATDFAEELLHLKKDPARRSPMFVVMEEAQLYAPQRTQRGDERMLGAFEDLVKLGRNYGIGVGMISQRPQAINKEILNQTELLIVLQTNGPQERKTIEGWIVENDADGVDLVDELPKLQTGEAFIWSPGWLRYFGKVKIGKKHTYDASATPDASTAAAMKPKAIDLGALETAMADAVEEAHKNDPKLLRNEIEKLGQMVIAAEEEASGDRATLEEVRRDLTEREHDLAEARAALERREETPREVSVLFPHHAKALEQVDTDLRELLEAIHGLNLTGRVDDLAERMEALKEEIESSVARRFEQQAPAPSGRPVQRPAPQPGAPSPAASARVVQRPAPQPGAPADGSNGLKKGARTMLEALAAARDGRLSKRWLSTWSGIQMGGTFSDYLSKLRTFGYIVDDGEIVEITATGAGIVGPVALRRADVLARLVPKLKVGAVRMFQAVVDARGPIAKAGISSASGIQQGGTFSDYLWKMRTLGLVEDDAAGRIELAAAIRSLR